MTAPKNRLPTPGAINDDLDQLDPGAVPTPRQPRVPGQGPRKIAVPRRSRQRLAPDDNWFYWCAYCNYCNTPSEGKRALCPDHRAKAGADSKARTRDPDRADGDYAMSTSEARELWKRANALMRAQQRHEKALRIGGADRTQIDLNRAIADLLRHIAALPEPPQP